MPSMNVEYRQAELEEFLAEWFTDPEPQDEPPCSRGNLQGIFGAATGAGSLSDDEILDRAPNAVNGQKFTRLFNGDTSAHPSQSEADLALCDMLAFWTGRDADQMDRLFRQSGLYRKKWDERRGRDTYGNLTIQKAIAGCREFYSGSGADRGYESTGGAFADFRDHRQLEGEQGQDKQERSNPRRFRLLHINEVVSDLRPPEYLIDGVVETGTLGELFGDPGTFKTFVLLSMLLSVASGQPWYGHAVKQGPVVYIVGEGRQGIARRLLAWGKYHGMDVSTLPFFISSMPAALTDPASAAEVAATIAEVTEQHGAPVAIAIDTLARNFGPGDENSTKDMGAFISNLDRYLGNSCVRMVVHHSGHGDKTRSRGNSALKGALDFEFNLSKKTGGKKDDITVEMWCTKMKDLPEWQRPKVFEPRTVTLNDDLLDPIQSVVLEEVDRVIEETSVAGSAKMQAAVDLLQELYSSHRGDLEASGNDPNDAKVTKGEWRDACVDRGLYKRPSTYTMMTAAAERGLIEIDDAYVFLKVSEV